MTEQRTLTLQAILVGITCALAFVLPNTLYAVLLGWLSALLLVHVMNRSCGAYKYLYIAFVVAHGIAFTWLIATISTFGNFPYWLSVLLYFLFCLTNSLYILVASFLFKHLPPFFHRWLIALPIGVTVAEFLSIRIFPWHYGHTQLAFSSLVQIADISGAPLVTFLLFWTASLIERTIRERKVDVVALPIAATLTFALIYGNLRINQFDSPTGPTHKISIVQGNIPIFDKHEPELYRANIDTYKNLGLAYEVKNNLIIWPETVVMAPLPAHNIAGRTLPFLSPIPKWLVGAMTLDDKNNVYNSAIAVTEGSKVQDIYHKLILMPFGEYVPFSKTFPWLLEAAHMAGELTPGDGIKVITYPATDETPELRVAPLVCYEDVVADLSRDAVRAGANLLINVTNDAWFSDTAAPYQHNLLASFRAIENRRYLIRAANTGLSAVITPTGKTASQLKTFSQGVLSTVIEPVNTLSPYSGYVGNKLLWGISLLSLGLSLLSFRRAPRNEK